MMRREIELQLQREQLRAQIAHERNLLARQTTPVSHSLDLRSRFGGVIDHARSFLARNPLFVGAAVAGLVLFKPLTLLRLSQRGLILWRTWRTVKTFVPRGMLAGLGRFMR